VALYDVDKTSKDRGNPMPNHNDTLDDGSIKAHGTNSVNYVTDASSSATTANLLSGNARLITTGLASVVAPNGSSGIIVTTTTTTPHNLNLGYTPMAVAYLNNVTGAGYGIPLPLWASFGANTGGTGGAPEYLGVVRYMTYAIDATNFYVLTYSSGSAVAANYTVTYYLYQQKAQ
jgi:hypothetical protein